MDAILEPALVKKHQSIKMNAVIWKQIKLETKENEVYLNLHPPYQLYIVLFIGIGICFIIRELFVSEFLIFLLSFICALLITGVAFLCPPKSQEILRFNKNTGELFKGKQFFPIREVSIITQIISIDLEEDYETRVFLKTNNSKELLFSVGTDQQNKIIRQFCDEIRIPLTVDRTDKIDSF